LTDATRACTLRCVERTHTRASGRKTTRTSEPKHRPGGGSQGQSSGERTPATVVALEAIGAQVPIRPGAARRPSRARPRGDRTWETGEDYSGLRRVRPCRNPSVGCSTCRKR
jgi:hypothetical protein